MSDAASEARDCLAEKEEAVARHFHETIMPKSVGPQWDHTDEGWRYRMMVMARDALRNGYSWPPKPKPIRESLIDIMACVSMSLFVGPNADQMQREKLCHFADAILYHFNVSLR